MEANAKATGRTDGKIMVFPNGVLFDFVFGEGQRKRNTQMEYGSSGIHGVNLPGSCPLAVKGDYKTTWPLNWSFQEGRSCQLHEIQKSLEYLIESLQECFAAKPHGVCYALEPLNCYEADLIYTLADGLDLIERVGANNSGLLLNTFHLNIEEASIEESIKICGDRIFHIHAAALNRWYSGAGGTS